MKKISLIFIFSLLFGQLFSNNPEKIVNHQIDAITIFLSSAEIARSANTQIPAGKTDLLLKGISSRMLDQGIKLFISNDVKVFAINKEINDLAFKENEVFQELEKQGKALSQERTTIRIERAILERELAYYESNMRLQKSDNVDFAAIDKGADYFRKKIREIETKLAEQERKKARLSKKEIKYSKEYKKAETQALRANTIIRITVESKTLVDAKIDLKYLVSNALWKPYYAVRAKENSKNVNIEYQAQLYNDTGNDWNNKPISLAILDSSDDVTKPELEVWTLEESESTMYSKRGKRNFAGSSNKPKGNNENEEEYENLEIDDLSTRFEIQDLHLIPSDATPHLIDIISYEKEVEFYNLSIPKVKNGAFLVARILDWESLGLIDGDINLYYNDTYQGISKLKTNEINDTLDLSMGKENNFIVSRKKVSSSSRKNLIGFNIKEIMTYEISVKNNKSSETTIEIRDQIPVSESKDIEVKAIKLDGGKLDPLTGQVTWDVAMKPGETKTFKLIFSIKYPKNKKDSIKYSHKVLVTPRYF